MIRISNYRKIYKQYYGQIPKDQDGRSFDIHHIDGNHTNNSPDNLRAVTIQKHYDIHYAQGEWSACQAIAMRMNIVSEKFSDLARKNVYRRVENETNPLLKKNRNKISCPYCPKIGDKNLMKRWHFDNCIVKRNVSTTGVKHKSHKPHGPRSAEHSKNQSIAQKEKKKPVRTLDHCLNISLSKKGKPSALKNKPREKIICTHCNKEGGDVQMKRWHFNNCKFKK
jgi:hypothetical protein